ncbi:hypothetical protein LBMAG46_35190 [Planctomycetia bacterium]|nr:hypothetical protein LBMAG46_35190 [Planctomycetia bacterium]
MTGKTAALACMGLLVFVTASAGTTDAFVSIAAVARLHDGDRIMRRAVQPWGRAPSIVLFQISVSQLRTRAFCQDFAACVNRPECQEYSAWQQFEGPFCQLPHATFIDIDRQTRFEQ